jgi:hypothetical protein
MLRYLTACHVRALRVISSVLKCGERPSFFEGIEIG